MLIGSLVTAAGLATAASAATGDEITGSIWQDYDSNGTFDSYENGLPGIEVLGYDGDGSVAGPVTTGADGSYALPVTSDAAQWRVEANLPDSPEWVQWRPSVVGSDGGVANGTTVQRVTVTDGEGAGGVDFSFQVPSAYVQNNPYVYLPEYRFGASDGDYGDLAGGEAIRYDAMSSDSRTVVPTTVQVPFSETGATNGSAWQRAAEPGGLGQMFTAAYVRRHAGLGPGGIGAIYRITPDGDSMSAPTGSAEVFVDLTDWGIDVGSDSAAGATTGDPLGLRPSVTAENPAYDWTRDAQAFDRVGLEGLGGLAFSPDETQMFAVNLHNRSLVRITTGTPATQVQDVEEFDLGFEGDMRPFGVSSDPITGAMYLTVTNTAESTQDQADLAGYVYRFSPDDPASLDLVLEFPLDFDRESRRVKLNGNHVNVIDVSWNPWTFDVADLDGPGSSAPMPMLADARILHGQLVLGVRDRYGDLVGANTFLGPDPTSEIDNRVVQVRSYGDVYLADNNPDGAFTLENNGVVDGVTGAGVADDQLGPGGYKYFSDYWHQDNGDGLNGQALGSIATIPSRDDGVLTTAVHAAGGAVQIGVRRLFQDTGDNIDPRGAIVIQNESPGAFPDTPMVTSKGNGLGAMAIAAAAAPIEIGNYVWYDEDHDGVQDAAEPPVPGATVNLYEVGDGGERTLADTTTTNDAGEYYFSSADESYALQTNRSYAVGIDNPDDYGPGGPLENWAPTLPDTGDEGATDPDRSDSDGLVEEAQDGTFPYAAITTSGPGENDHTIDFGYAPTEYSFEKRTVAGPTENPDGDGTWEVEYELVTENPGTIDGSYTLTDDLTNYGESVVVTAAEVVSAPVGVALNPDWDGVEDQRITTSEVPIAAGSTVAAGTEHVYRIQVTVALATDADTGEVLADPSQLRCTPDQTGENATGLFNTAAMDANSHEELTDGECADLPVVTLAKTVSAEPHPVDPVNNPGEYEISYGLSVTNETSAATSYDLSDPLQFGAGIEIVPGSVQASAVGGGVVVNDGYDGAADTLVAADVPIAGSAVHDYEITVRYTVDLATEGGATDPSSCTDPAGDGERTGVYNSASTSFNGYPDIDDACREVGQVSHTKTLVSAQPVGDGQWEVVYELEVTNAGVEQVGYDLDDQLHLGEGIEIAEATVTAAPEGVALAEPEWDGQDNSRLVTGASIAGTDDDGYAPHVYQVSVLADVPLAFDDPVASVDPATCGDGAVGEVDPEARGFLNVSHLADEVGGQEDDGACASVPEFSIDKTAEAATAAEDGTLSVTYGIEVANTGGQAGSYDLTDELRFDDSIEVLEASVTAPEGVPAEAAWNGAAAPVIASDVVLEAGEVHQYEVQVRVAVEDSGDAGAVTEAFTCPAVGSQESGGLSNVAALVHNDLSVSDTVCAGPPDIPPSGENPPADPPSGDTPPADPAGAGGEDDPASSGANGGLPSTGANGVAALAGLAALAVLLGAVLVINRSRRKLMS